MHSPTTTSTWLAKNKIKLGKQKKQSDDREKYMYYYEFSHLKKKEALNS